MSDLETDAKAERHIVERLRAELTAIANRVGATLEEGTTDLGRDDKWSPFFKLTGRSGTATIEVMPDGAWSLYLAVGYAGSIEILASPREPDTGVQNTLEVVEAIVQGRLKERVWRSRSDNNVVASALRIRLNEHDRWRIIGRVGAVAPLIGRLLYKCEVVHYRSFKD